MATTANTDEQHPPVHITGALPQNLPGYTTVASFPPGSFLENLAVRRDGSILASDMLSGSIWYINPHAEDGDTQGSVELVHKFELQDASTEEPLTGNVDEEEAEEGHGSYSSTPAAEAIIESPTEPDLFYLFSGIHGKKGTWWVYELDMRSFIPSSNRTRTATTTDDEGEQPHQGVKVRRLAPVPTVTWLNGGTAIPHPSEPLILMAESYQGSLYSYNIKTGSVGVWLQHTLLGKMTTRPPWPGVNGVKYHHDGRDGWVYFTNSDRAILGRVRVNRQGDMPVAAQDPQNGQVEIESLANGCGGDDLCLDGQGNIYVATNPHDTVLKFPRLASLDAAQAQRGKKGQPERQVILGLRRRQLSAEQASSPPKPDSEFEVDSDTTGPTAVAFGTTASDKKDLYVVTNGGIINPLDGVVREARVLRVHL